MRFMIYYYLQKITSLLENSGPQATCSSGFIFCYTIKIAAWRSTTGNLPGVRGEAVCKFWVGVCDWDPETLVPDTVQIPYSRPKLSDFYTLSQTKLVENRACSRQ